MTALAALVAAVLIVVALVVGSAQPAAAHAQLQSTSPSASAVLDRSPAAVTLTFNEPVEASLGAIRMFDSDSRRLTLGRPEHPDGNNRAIRIPLPRLSDGLYVVTWRVLSADTHPVRGAFTFRVGSAAPDTTGLAAQLLAAGDGSPVVGALFAAVRLVAFASVALLTGGGAFLTLTLTLALAWPPAGVGFRRVRRLLWAAWAGALASTVVGIAVQGPYAAALPLRDALVPAVIGDVLGTRFGQVWAARAVLLVMVVAPLLAYAFAFASPSNERARPDDGHLPRWWVATGALSALALCAAPGLAGHASAGPLVGLALPVDTIHVAATSLWLGGLVVVATCVLPAVGTEASVSAIRMVVLRFSSLAFASMVVIVVTGAFQSWRQVGSLGAFSSTTYGQLLLAKLIAFSLVIGLAAASRQVVRTRLLSAGPAGSAALASSPGPGPGAMLATPMAHDEARRLRRTVGAEVVLAIVVLAVTALLVNAEPGRSALARPFSAELRAGSLLVDLTIDPAQAGPTEVHLYTLTPDGAPAPVQEVTARMTLPERGIDPLEVPLQRAGPNHFSAYGFDVPLPGTWQLEVVARLNEVDLASVITTVPIR